MSLSTQVLSMLKLRQPKARRPRSERKPTRSSIPRWLGGSSSSLGSSGSSASRSRPRTPPGVIYIPELLEDSDQNDDDYCRDEDEDDGYTTSARSHRSVFSNMSRSSARFASSVDAEAPSLAQSLKRTTGKLHSLVHRALHPDKLRHSAKLHEQPQSRSSIIKALASRLSMSSCTTTSSQSNRDEDDDCADVESGILRENKSGKVEFLFFPGCPDNLNVYELEVSQYRRRTNFASSPLSTEKQAPPPPSAAETIAVGPTIVRAMPPLFTPRLKRGVSSNLLVESGTEDYDAVQTW